VNAVAKIDMVSFLIVNFNTPALCYQAIESIVENTVGVDYEIILADNGSKKHPVDHNSLDFKEVQLINLPKNIGFGRANNAAYEKAKGDYIFLLNSDAYLIEKSTISRMVNYLESYEKVAMVGPNFIKKDGSQNYAYGNLLGKEKLWVDAGLKSVADSYYNDKLIGYKVSDIDEPTSVGYLGAAGVMIKRSSVNKIGGLFDPDYFLYFEDMDLGWRIQKAGLSSVLLPFETVVHIGGESSGVQSKWLKAKIKESKKSFVRKRYGSLFTFMYGIIVFLSRTFKRFVRMLKRMF
jgi:hypothetical protein